MEKIEAENEICIWKKDDPLCYSEDDSWDTSCGDKFLLIEGTPKENKFFFCPNCGKRIKEG
jgi:hypothetical protein